MRKDQKSIHQVPHLTQDTNGKVINLQLDTTNESQEVSPFPAGDHKAHINRRSQSPMIFENDFLFTKNALVKLLPVNRYSVDVFSRSGPSGILGSDGKQHTAKASARGRENCCTFH